MSCSSSPSFPPLPFPSPSLPFPPPPSAPQLLLSFYPPLPVPTPHSPFLPNTRSPPAPPATSSASQQTAPTTPRTAATVESLSSKAQASASVTEDGPPFPKGTVIAADSVHREKFWVHKKKGDSLGFSTALLTFDGIDGKMAYDGWCADPASECFRFWFPRAEK